MAKYFLNLEVVAAAITSLLVSSHVYVISGESNPLQFKSIGNADGKMYFLDATNAMNWTAAGNYCTQYGYQFPTIETINQSRLLNTALFREFGTTSRYAWINAKEKRMVIPLAWANDTNLQAALFPGNLLQQTLPATSSLQCAVIAYQSAGLRATHSSCTVSRNVLCQLTI